jgi:hypothetical protein
MAIVDWTTQIFEVAPKFVFGKPKKNYHQLWRLKVGDQKFLVINRGDQKLMTKNFQLPFNDRKIKFDNQICFWSPYTMGATEM